MNILGYNVMRIVAGQTEWLSVDEHSWTSDYFSSATFTDPVLANDIGERESYDVVFYVMAVMGSV